MPLLFLALLTAPPALAAGPPPEPDVSEIAIYPGFERHEIAASARATLAAAVACLRSAPPPAVPAEPVTAPLLTAKVIDGEPISLVESAVEVRCKGRPVRRCSFRSAYHPGSGEVGYASIQCFGSHQDPYTSYLVTASRDLSRARRAGVAGTRRDRAVRQVGLNFQTNEFPGTQLTAFAEVARADGEERTACAVHKFDDYDAVDTAASAALDGAALDALVVEVLQVACAAVGRCALPPRSGDRGSGGAAAD